MALPSAPNSISMSQVNTELSKTATATINLNDTEVRNLAGVGGSGTIISMDNLRGKSAFTLAIQGSTGPVYFEQNTNNYDLGIKLVIGSNGSINMFDYVSNDFTTSTPDSSISALVNGAVTNFPTAWGTPLTAGVGGQYEVRYSGYIEANGDNTITRVFGVGYQNTFNYDNLGGDPQDWIYITTPWYALSVDRTITMLATGADTSTGRAVLGEWFYNLGNNGTMSIRRIGTTSPVATFTIGAIIAEKEGD